MPAYPNTLMFGRTVAGENVPVQVDADGKLVVDQAGGGFTPPVTIPNDTTIFKNGGNIPILITTYEGDLEASQGLVAGDNIRGETSSGANQVGGILPLAGGSGTGSGAGGDITFSVALPGASNVITNELVTAASGAADTEIGPYTVAAPQGGILSGSVSIVDDNGQTITDDGVGGFTGSVAANVGAVGTIGSGTDGTVTLQWATVPTTWAEADIQNTYTVEAVNDQPPSSDVFMDAPIDDQFIVHLGTDSGGSLDPAKNTAALVAAAANAYLGDTGTAFFSGDGSGVIGVEGPNAFAGAVGPSTIDYTTGEVAFSYAAPYVGNVVINYTNQRQNTLTQVGKFDGATGGARFNAAVPPGVDGISELSLNDGTASVQMTAAVNDDGAGVGTAGMFVNDVNGNTSLFVRGDGLYIGGTPGVSGTFLSADAKTVTVTKGIITSIV